MYMSMSEKIKLIRKNLHLPQWKIAELCSVSQSYWSEIEMGEKQPNGAIILTLVSDFNVNPMWLKTGFGFHFSRGCRIEKDCPFQHLASSYENDYLAAGSVGEKRIAYKADSVSEFPFAFFFCPGKLGFETEAMDCLLIDTKIKEIDKKGIFLLQNSEKGHFLFSYEYGDKRHISNDTLCLGKVLFVIKRV